MPQKTTQPRPSSQKSKVFDPDIEENKVIAAIGYIWILCLVPLFLKRNSKFAQFHAKQGLILFAIEVIGSLFFWIPLIGWALAVLVVVIAVMGFLKAFSGEYWRIPYLGDYAEKISL